jgi:hypothetical protein
LEWFIGGTQVNRVLVLLILISGCSYTHPQSIGVAGDRVTTVVMIDYVKGKQVVIIDGQATPPGKILFKLSDIRKAITRSGDAPATVLAHERTTVHDLLSMNVALMKAGFGSIKYFSFSEDKSSMFEITFSPPVPFDSSGRSPSHQN